MKARGSIGFVFQILFFSLLCLDGCDAIGVKRILEEEDILCVYKEK